MSKGAPVEPRPRGIARDMSQIKRHGGASAAELADFLSQLRGRRPQEVLGLVAQSGLLRATALATVGIVILMAALTVVPYALAKMFPEVSQQQTAAGTADAAAGSTEEQASAAAAVPSDSATGGTARPREDELEPELDAETMERLGIEETVPTDPSVNPLEDRFDDLLDDAE